jgi:hypothetical protein
MKRIIQTMAWLDARPSIYLLIVAAFWIVVCWLEALDAL